MRRRILLSAPPAAAAIVVARFSSLERSETHTVSTAAQQAVAFEALNFAGWLARRRHDRECADFAAAQQAVLRSRLEANKDAAYGVAHGFSAMLHSEVDLVTAFRTSHPVTRYDHYVPWVARVASGESHVINAESETQLAATSGTSGQRALLPYTKTMASKFFLYGILVVFDVLNRTLPESLGLQRTCKLAFAPIWSWSEGGLRIGPNSSGPADPSFKRLLPLYSTPWAGYTIDGDERTALYVHALFAIRDAKLGCLEANFVNLPYRLLQLVQEHGEQLADDLERGAIDVGVAGRLGMETASALNTALGCGDPQRAAALREALRHPDGEVGLARRIWPKLRLVLANATGAFEPYAEKMRTGVGAGVPILSTVYAASEGLMGISLHPADDGSAIYCLVPSAMFFEFLPLDGVDSANVDFARDKSASDASVPLSVQAGAHRDAHGGTLLPHELVTGQDYELVVTTLGGLCRYRIGDVVRMVGRHGDAPLVEFRYRQGQLLNLRGEKTSEPQLAAAVGAVFDASAVVEYTTTEHLPKRGLPHYRLYLERAPNAPPLTRETAAAMDQALGAANPVYATWRAKRAIGACELVDVPTGGFEALRERRLSEGASVQQLKVSRVLRSEAHEDVLRVM